MLRALGLTPFKRLHVHGYWNINEAKMSKSIGNVVRPEALRQEFGVDRSFGATGGERRWPWPLMLAVTLVVSSKGRHRCTVYCYRSRYGICTYIAVIILLAYRQRYGVVTGIRVSV